MGTENRPHIEITTAIGCPIQCRYCPQDVLKGAYKGEKVLDLPKFIQICEKIPQDVDIHFSGMCEPFINLDAIEMVEYAAKKHAVSIFTTLKGLNIPKYERLRELKFRWFCVHIPDGQLNTKLKCNPEYLQLLRHVTNNQPECEKFWFSVHGDYHPAVVPIVLGYECENTMIDRAGNLDLAWSKFDHSRPVRCACGSFNQNVLLPNGDVVLCCMDYGMKHVIGNLVSQDYGQLKRLNQYELCKKCNRGVV
jgi:hypothetical protein